MSVSSVFGHLIELEGMRPYYIRFTASEESRGQYLERLIDRAHNELTFRSGEVNPNLWERPRIVNALTRFVENRGGNIEFTFTKTNSDGSIVTTKEEAKERLQEQSPGLVELATKFPGKIKFYWLKERLQQHCQIGDNRDLILEEFNHKPKERPWVDILFNHNRLAAKWRKRFQDSIKEKNAEEISFA